MPTGFNSQEENAFGHGHHLAITNLLSKIFSALTLILAIIIYGLFGWGPTLPFIVLVSALFIGIVILNNTGYVNLGRLLFCLVPVWMTLFISILGKFTQEKQSYIIYFDIRYLLLATAILPAVAFDFQEKIKIAVCLGSSFVCLIFFDPIHNALGVGYYQRGFNVTSYYYINYITFISFGALCAGIFVLKWQNWKASQTLLASLDKNKAINQALQISNKQLAALAHETETQNEEIKQQQEEMKSSQEMLERASQIISQQKLKLEEYSLHLENLVEEKNADLVKANHELIKSNNELRQFSFTVSHNLRGPVARLLGLTKLMESSRDEEDLANITQYVYQSAAELDDILRDLTTIIDIRNELYRVREKIDLQEEWDRALSLLGEQSTRNAKISSDFSQHPHIYGIRPMVQSILFNLLSNSIKYQSPERVLEIQARSVTTNSGQIKVEVKDNGLGIDLKNQQENLFKLYKRFHYHVSGKGMGLYLVRSQMEIMEGRVEVESEVDKGALFRLIFTVSPDLAKQVFFENDAAQLYYDALINNTVIIWKKNVTSIEYRHAFEKVLQTIKKYNTPGWIADLRNQGVISAEDQKWFISNVLKTAAQNGLIRIAAIGFNDPIRKDYYNRMIATTEQFGITLQVFETLEQGIQWMDQNR